MKLLNLFLAGTLAVGFAACSSEEPAAVNGAETETTTESSDGLYATVKFSFPQSRSTQKEGEEIGQNYENAVNSVLVVAATKETNGSYKFLTAAYNDNAFSGNATTATYTLYFQDRSKLYFDEATDVNIFAYCNPTADLIKKFLGATVGTDGKYENPTLGDDELTNLICDANLADTWKENQFLMTSVEMHTATIPVQADLKKHNTPATALNLGNIEVIRTAARFDFKDKSTLENLTYDIKNPVDADETLGTVTLKRAALFNTRKEFYYLPRTNAANGLCPGYANMEVIGNTVIMTPTPASFDKQLVEINNSNYGDFAWTSLGGLTTDDNDNEWNNTAATDKQGYKILTYTTENTLNAADGDPTSTNTTGIVFEAEMNVSGFEEGKPMYEFEGQIYPTARALYDTVKTAPGSKIETAFNQTFDVDGETVTEKTDVQDKTSLNGFTIYRPREDNKYYCYYYYYNRHNDNGDPATTGSMEFATVRNNVYKLAVTKINKFGTFVAPEPDEFEIYFNVTVEVKPWVVRINDIEF